MGRAVKLKRQRKRKQQQEQSFSSTQWSSTFIDPELGLDPVEDRVVFPAIDWLADQWSTVPEFSDDFTLDEAKQIAERTLCLLFDAVTQTLAREKKLRESSLEWQISDRFKIHLFFTPHPPSIDTLVLNTINKEAFDLSGNFRFS